MGTRRQFLRTVGKSAAIGAVAGPWVWSPRTAWAANDRIAVGIIGVGTMGRGHLGAMLGRGDVQV
ncbi:MAG: twin-arginine translocation signal domain-containing protein, partial [Thermogemmata sp.]|nr:twin-arginine translocation signal domain-containing protein [Thermogemmata sp.]